MTDQIHIELLTHSVHSDLTKLLNMRTDPVTAHLLEAELDHLSSSLTLLQLLISHIQGAKPTLRVVR